MKSSIAQLGLYEEISNSCLRRRRLSLSYRIGIPVPLGRTTILGGIVLIALSLVGVWVAQERPTLSKETPIAFDSPTSEGRLDRFCYVHTVRKGDTLWDISESYTGFANHKVVESIRQANPWLPKDPTHLDEGKTIKIPIQEGGCNHINQR